MSEHVRHPAEFICDELVHRGWTTTRLVGVAGGTSMDVLALDLYICVPDVDCRVGDLAEVLGRGFDVSPDLFRNLERAWLESSNRVQDFEPPEQVFASHDLIGTLTDGAPT